MRITVPESSRIEKRKYFAKKFDSFEVLSDSRPHDESRVPSPGADRQEPNILFIWLFSSPCRATPPPVSAGLGSRSSPQAAGRRPGGPGWMAGQARAMGRDPLWTRRDARSQRQPLVVMDSSRPRKLSAGEQPRPQPRSSAGKRRRRAATPNQIGQQLAVEHRNARTDCDPRLAASLRSAAGAG
jgi:hypothetical protein